MTSFAFILGVVPLVLATGAGAEMRRTLGIAVFSGMLGVTVFGIFFTPVFYSVVRKFTESKVAEQGSAASGTGKHAATSSEKVIATTDGHLAQGGASPQAAH